MNRQLIYGLRQVKYTPMHTFFLTNVNLICRAGYALNHLRPPFPKHEMRVLGFFDNLCGSVDNFGFLGSVLDGSSVNLNEVFLLLI